MKRTVLTAVSIAVIVGSAHAGLTAHWRFDEASGSTAFASAGGVNGALNGSAAFVSGVSGNAISVTKAGSGWVNFGNNFANTSSYSLSFWVKTAAGFSDTDSIIVAKHEAGTPNGYFMGLNQNGPYGTANKAWGYHSSLPGNQPTSSTSVNDGGWHLVSAAFAAGPNTHSIYVDGLLEDTKAGVGMVGNSSPLFVGAVNLSGSPLASFTGTVDDLQIYDHALTSDEVLFLNNNPGQAVPEPLTVCALGLGGLALIRKRRKVA